MRALITLTFVSMLISTNRVSANDLDFEAAHPARTSMDISVNEGFGPGNQYIYFQDLRNENIATFMASTLSYSGNGNADIFVNSNSINQHAWSSNIQIAAQTSLTSFFEVSWNNAASNQANNPISISISGSLSSQGDGHYAGFISQGYSYVELVSQVGSHLVAESCELFCSGLQSVEYSYIDQILPNVLYQIYIFSVADSFGPNGWVYSDANFSMSLLDQSSTNDAYILSSGFVRATPGPIAGAGLPILSIIFAFIFWHRRALGNKNEH